MTVTVIDAVELAPSALNTVSRSTKISLVFQVPPNPLPGTQLGFDTCTLPVSDHVPDTAFCESTAHDARTPRVIWVGPMICALGAGAGGTV